MKKNSSNIVALVLALLLAVGAVALAWPLSESYGWSLDFAGGTAWTLTPDSGDDVSDDVNVMNQRVHKSSLNGADVSAGDDGAITVTVPANQEASEALAYLGKKGVVELIRLDTVSDAEALAKIRNGVENVALTEGTYETLIDASGFKSASTISGYTGYVTLTFTSDASKTFQEVTAELADVYGQLALVVDGEVVATTYVYQEMTGGQVSVSTGLTDAEAGALAAVISAGQLSGSYTVDGSTEYTTPASEQPVLWIVGICSLFLLLMLVVSLVCAKKLGLATWGGWVFTAVYLLGLAGLLAKDAQFNPSITNILILIVATACCAGAFDKVARSLAKGAKIEEAVRANLKAIGTSILTVVVLAAVEGILTYIGGEGLGIAWAVLLALPAALVAFVLAFLPLANLLLSTGSKPHQNKR